MPSVRLVHWKEEESAARAAILSQLGHDVDASPFSLSSLKALRDKPPGAIVIDLSRRPGDGREVAVLLRQRKATRFVPLIFVEGDPEKVNLLKTVIPDARFTSYDEIGPVIEHVLANPARDVVIPRPLSGGNAPVPLGKKLGVKPGRPVGLIGAPPGFEAAIPEALCKRNPRGAVALTLWFVSTRRELETRISRMRRRAQEGGLWIVWPKQTSHAKAEINGNTIRAAALAAGLVDFKICAIDPVWSGMRFAVKRQTPPRQRG